MKMEKEDLKKMADILGKYKEGYSFENLNDCFEQDDLFNIIDIFIQESYHKDSQEARKQGIISSALKLIDYNEIEYLFQNMLQGQDIVNVLDGVMTFINEYSIEEVKNILIEKGILESEN